MIILDVMLGVSLASSSGCVRTTDEDALKFRDVAVNIFLAYTRNKVKEYQVSGPVLCDGRFYMYSIDGTGKYQTIGGSWTVTFDKASLKASIDPGE